MAVVGFVKENLRTPKNSRFPYDRRSGLAHEKGTQ